MKCIKSYYCRYLYTEFIDINADNAGSLLYAARRLELAGLTKLCFRFLDEHMAIGNVCKILEQAHTYKENNLYDKCLKFIHTNGFEVLPTNGFNELCLSCVEDVIKSDVLKVDEMTLFETMMNWGTSECRRRKLAATDANRRTALGELLYLIRFPTMDVSYFTQKVSFRDILSDDEAVAIFQYFHGQEQPLARKFNRNDRNWLRNQKPLTDKNFRQGNRSRQKAPAMTTAQFVESRMMMRNSPVMRNTPVTRNPPVMNDFPVIQERTQRDDVIPLPLPPEPNFCRVTRFRTHDGQWKQNGPPDAISFYCSNPIVLYGVEIYGCATGVETYKIELYLYDDMKEEISKNHITVATNSVRLTYDVMFARPVRIPPQRTFTVAVHIKGGPCHKGVDGTSFNVSHDVRFEFSNSNRSSNGSDVTVGQIPTLLFNKTE